MASYSHYFVIGCLLIVLNQSLGEFTYVTRCYNVTDYQHCLWTEMTGRLAIALTWQEAQQTCQLRNAILVSITSSEVESIMSQFRSYVATIDSNYINTGVWINARGTSANDFHWITGTTASVDVVDEVSDNVVVIKRFAAIGLSSSNNNTLVYRAYAYGQTDVSDYICQFSKGPIGDIHCTYGLLRSTKCYLKYSETVTWFTASNRCLSMNSSLATFNDLRTPSDDIRLTSWLNITGTTKYWIGLVRQWFVITAQDGSVSDIQYTNWEGDHPKGPDDINRCILLLKELVVWEDRPKCNDSQRFACQTIIPLFSTTSSTTQTLTASTIPASISGTSTGIRNVDIGHNMASTTVTDSGTVSDGKSVSNVIALAVGVGVGVGAPVIIAVIVVAVVLAARRRRHKRRKKNSATSSADKREEHVNGNNARQTDTFEMSRNNKTQTADSSPESSSAQHDTTNNSSTTTQQQTGSSTGVYAELVGCSTDNQQRTKTAEPDRVVYADLDSVR